MFFDLETTGLEVGKDRVIEISMIKMNVDGTKEKYYSLFEVENIQVKA